MSLTQTEAARFLGITLPVTKNQLKRAYHRRSLEEHPDVSKAKDAKERFTKLTSCYELLGLAAAYGSDVVEDFQAEVCCTDGTPVSKCGNGLGPTTNGTPCGDCSGRGFTAFGMEACPDCMASGWDLFWLYKCWVCKGIGEIQTENCSHECGNCRSQGWVKGAKLGNHCKTCKGTHQNTNGRKTYGRCLRCKGCGELPMWNPVLPRGPLL